MIGPLTQAAIDDIERAGLRAYISDSGDEMIVTARSEWGETQRIWHPWGGLVHTDVGLAKQLRSVARNLLHHMIAKVNGSESGCESTQPEPTPNQE